MTYTLKTLCEMLERECDGVVSTISTLHDRNAVMQRIGPGLGWSLGCVQETHEIALISDCLPNPEKWRGLKFASAMHSGSFLISCETWTIERNELGGFNSSLFFRAIEVLDA